MTREEAMKSLKKLKSFHNGSYGAVIDMAIKALEQQPSEDWKFYYKHGYAQAKRDLSHKWIPVSERLPENRKEVVVYLSSGEITIGKYNEHKLPFNDYPIGWGYPDKYGYIDFTKENVIAWMPLPEPYKEGEE